MQFMVVAYLKKGSEKQLPNFSDELNEHFAQAKLKMVGRLLDRDGHGVGYLGFVDGDSFEDAERYVEQGPFYRHDLFEVAQILQYELEIGRFGE